MKHYITDKQMEKLKLILESFAEEDEGHVYVEQLRGFQFLIEDIEIQILEEEDCNVRS